MQNLRAAEMQTEETEEAGLESIADVSDEALAAWRQSLSREHQAHLTRLDRSFRRRLDAEKRHMRTELLDDRRKYEAKLKSRENELQRLHSQMDQMRASEQGASDFSVDLQSTGANALLLFFTVLVALALVYCDESLLV